MGKLVRSLMKSRVPKEMFKSLKLMNVKFNPFDDSATTARELLKRVNTRPVRAANPKLKIDLNIVEEIGNPLVMITYNDGHEQTLNTKSMKIAEIMDEIEKVARWKVDDVVNPFGHLREARKKELGL